jgi:hypothetical protein
VLFLRRLSLAGNEAPKNERAKSEILPGNRRQAMRLAVCLR